MRGSRLAMVAKPPVRRRTFHDRVARTRERLFPVVCIAESVRLPDLGSKGIFGLQHCDRMDAVRPQQLVFINSDRSPAPWEESRGRRVPNVSSQSSLLSRADSIAQHLYAEGPAHQGSHVKQGNLPLIDFILYPNSSTIRSCSFRALPLVCPLRPAESLIPILKVNLPALSSLAVPTSEAAPSRSDLHGSDPNSTPFALG